MIDDSFSGCECLVMINAPHALCYKRRSSVDAMQAAAASMAEAAPLVAAGAGAGAAGGAGRGAALPRGSPSQQKYRLRRRIKRAEERGDQLATAGLPSDLDRLEDDFVKVILRSWIAAVTVR